MDDKNRWHDKTTLHRECYESRKRERINEDGSFRPHQKGIITATYIADWFLREGQSRQKLGEWMKMTSVRSQDQRRILQATTHSFKFHPTHGYTTARRRKNETSATCARHSG